MEPSISVIFIPVRPVARYYSPFPGSSTDNLFLILIQPEIMAPGGLDF